MDMTQTIMPKTDQLNADSLIGGDLTITVRKVSADPSAPEQPVAVFYEGDDGKPYKPCKSMRRVMVSAWGPDASQYVGRSLVLYRDPEVQFGGMRVGGIRIRAMSHIERDMTMALTASKAQRKPYTVRKLAVSPPSQERPRDDAASPEALKARAQSAAQQGTVTFKGFWESTLTKQERTQLAGELAGLKDIAKQADERGAPTEADPFSGAAGPSDEDQARAAFEEERRREMAEAGERQPGED